jgi:hypothetical protein
MKMASVGTMLLTVILALLTIWFLVPSNTLSESMKSLSTMSILLLLVWLRVEYCFVKKKTG